MQTAGHTFKIHNKNSALLLCYLFQDEDKQPSLSL